MKNPIQLSIPQPCHENWDNMAPVDKGRFCASCQKNVRDFTRSSDREIAETLKKEGKLCGRFRASQLNRDLYVPKEKSKFWAAASATAITLLTFGVNEVSAQTPAQTEQHEGKDNSDKSLPSVGLKTITGTVLDDTGMPIPGANVYVKGNTAPSVRTDFDGIFFLKAKDGDNLVVEYIGMKTQIVKVNSSGTIPDVIMSDGEVFLGGIEIVERTILLTEDKRLRISVASQYMFDY